ncbi:hypothetical protein [Actinomadura violacea]|uniref:Uncharacterized protein n=1 Tax=Actinomadura violacea TaxID=2819934 RepID=A0ABS3RQ75_9ACTN|nr:hypothetical protein [Actinomadura violacea]MBO2458892.1 hypothetical protein [Actinomadura violacea]
MAIGVDAAVVLTTAIGLAFVPRLVRSGDSGGGAGRAWARPEVFLCLVVLLVYLNQVLFTVYILRVHAGGTSFIARYVPEGWFALADGSAMRSLAAHFPHPELLAPSMLRVPAFLELPFGLLSYVTVLRWLDRGLYKRVATSWTVWAASLSYTFAFCAVEWILDTPYAVDDIVIRACTGLVTPLLIRWLARQDTDAPAIASFAQMLLFAVSVWALGQLVLTVYDTALLYNLGHLGGRLPGAVVTAAILVAARWQAARTSPGGASGLALNSIGTGLRWALALFFVAALPIRYGVNFGTPLIAGVAGLLICVAAGVHALREGLAGAGTRRTILWALQIAAALPAGGAAGVAAVWLVTDTYYEAGVLRAAALCFAVAVAVCALTDRWIDRRVVTSPETAAPEV